MKYIDKLLKILKTSRNTFFTYIFTLVSLYLSFDRIVEILFMVFTGVSQSYWGPLTYTAALACPILAYLFSPKSEFATSKNQKVSLFNLYIISFYIIVLSMFTQWLNAIVWILLFLLTDYVDLVSNFSEVVFPALSAISLVLPLSTAYPLFQWLYLGVNDVNSHVRSIWDYGGIDLSDPSKGRGPFACEISLCTDDDYGNKVVMHESTRFRPTFVCGSTGSGKTALIFEPMIAKDLEKKRFFLDASKDLGFAALKTRLAYLSAPYTNEYLNENFTLDLLTPAPGKETVFKSFVSKMHLANLNGSTIYKNLGVTVVSPDHEIITHMAGVAKNFGQKINLVDPNNPDSIGLNPFVYDEPFKIAVTISSAVRSMFNTFHLDLEEAYREDAATQALENLAILLKEIYPKMHDGLLPNIEDLLKLLTNFGLVEKMCKILEKDEVLKERYCIQIDYFKAHFFADAPFKDEIKHTIFPAITSLDSLLRLPGVKSILCNRHNNINFDKMLSEGQITLLCTRRGDLGSTAHKAFGLFFLTALENAVLRRPGSEDSRVPNFLYIDEFPEFLSRSTESIFTMFRKYKIGTVISSQNLSQLEHSDTKENYRETILANCTNKIFTGGATPDDLQWWSTEFGQRREWKFTESMDLDKCKYDSKIGGVTWKYISNFSVGRLQAAIVDTKAAYKLRLNGGRIVVGAGRFNYLASKYKEATPTKIYNFEKFLDSSGNHNHNDTPDNQVAIQSDYDTDNFENSAIISNYKKKKY